MSFYSPSEEYLQRELQGEDLHVATTHGGEEEEEEEEEDGNGHESELWMGEAASLEPLRSALTTEEQLSVLAKDERVLLPRTAVAMTVQEEFTNVPGHLILTSRRCLFVSAKDATTDLSIGAECIQLHAQAAADPFPSIYLQLQTADDEDDHTNEDTDPTEVSIVPLDQASCDTIFAKFSELISLNPIQPDADNNNNNDDRESALMGMMMMMGGTTPTTTTGFVTSDDMIVASPQRPTSPHQFSDVDDDDDYYEDGHEDEDEIIEPSPAKRPRELGSDEGATAEERARMLEHLDSILVVRPELEIQDEEQFADADEEQELVDTMRMETHKKQNENETTTATVGASGGGQFDDADDEDDPLL